MRSPTEPQSLDFLLAQISRLHHYRAHELFSSLGLYRGQPPLLFELWKQNGQTHGELAEKMRITPATATRMIQRMEKTGFVQRRPDASDQRVSRVYLTETGQAVREQLQQVWQQMEIENFGNFSAQEQAVLRDFLTRIRSNLIRATGEKISL